MAAMEEGKKKWESDGAAVEDSNMAMVGSAEDKAARKAAAEKEPAWVGCGTKVGLEIWRIEKFKVVPWPKEEYGKFYEGDSYICLSTTTDPENDEKLVWDIHFWLGKTTSTDEKGTAAYKTVELDDLMGGAPIQHRECMQHESTEFCKLFPEGISYLEGGIDSGFRHVEKDAYIAKLLHVRKTKKHGMRVLQVPCSRESLNHGDCFILDAGADIFCWNGDSCSPFEKRECNTFAENMENQRGGAATVTHEITPKFWALLGGEGPIKSADEVTDDTELAETGEGVLYRISDESGELLVSEMKRGDLKLADLDSKDVMLVDTAAGEIFLWVGAGASDLERSQAMTTAELFLKASGKPMETSIHMFREGQKIKNDIWNEVFD